MKILAILLVKNEVDIVGAALKDAVNWARRIFVIDNGSTDGTWELIQALAGEVVVPWRRELGPYRRALRAEAFNAFHGEASAGDWWCRMDADEFYAEDPRAFLAAVPRRYHVVLKKSLDYRITREDLAEHEFTGRFDEDRPYIRYIKPACQAEFRFFRHSDRVRWDATGNDATDGLRFRGVHYPRPIPVRHYPYRSPKQMQERLDIRNAIPRDVSGRPFRHITETRWEELLGSRDEFVLDKGAATYAALPLRRPIKDNALKALHKRVLRLLPWTPASRR
jgi:glycosyltransferase involved in cell wall biosynthesis